MVEYRIGRESEKDDIVDLINYVFSFDHCPHDFKKRNPACYDSDYPFWKDHYVAVENGRLLATLSVTTRDWNGMKCGHIGQVCVHPYHRGRGLMKVLMKMAMEEMEQQGYAFAELNGLRQRYEYFGFSRGGARYRIPVTSVNLRHCPPADLEAISLQPDQGSCFTVCKNGLKIGTVSPFDAALADEAELPAVLARYFQATGTAEYTFLVSPYVKERLQVLTKFCEDFTLEQGMQYRVFRFRDVITQCLQKRNDLWDGIVTFFPPKEAPFTVQVQQGTLTVTDAPEGTQSELLPFQEQLFGILPSCLLPEEMAKTNWFPLVLA